MALFLGERSGENVEPSISFLEGELGFSFDKEYRLLRVELNFNFHPKGESYIYGENGDEKYTLEYSVDSGLARSIDALKTLADKFPERMKNKRGT